MYIVFYLIFLVRLQFVTIGEIIYISDGDTYHIRTTKGEKIKIRLEGIDCPESTQAFGLEAKEFAVKQVLNKQVKVRVIDTDRYGRKVARIIYDGNKDLSKVLLANGFAWHYKKYNLEDELAELEILARKQKKGLWAQDNPMPPWEFRKGRNAGSSKVNLEENEVLICNSSSAGSYHNHHCRGLNQCKAEVIKISILKAKADNRKACGFCY